MYPSIAMSTNLSRISRFASVLWIEGAPYTLEELSSMYDDIQSEKDPKKLKEKKRFFELAVLDNTNYIENFFGLYFTPEENAVTLCKSMFGFPDFDDIDQIVSQE